MAFSLTINQEGVYDLPASNAKFTVSLPPEQRAALQTLVEEATLPARVVRRAAILLRADEGGGRTADVDTGIAQSFGVCLRTVRNVRRTYVARGLEPAIYGVLCKTTK
jgi:hypothetical protein